MLVTERKTDKRLGRRACGGDGWAKHLRRAKKKAHKAERQAVRLALKNWGEK